MAVYFTLCHFHINGFAVSNLTPVDFRSQFRLIVCVSLALTSHINNSVPSIIRAILCVRPITISVHFSFSANTNKEIGSTLFCGGRRKNLKGKKRRWKWKRWNGAYNNIDFHEEFRNQWPVKNSLDIISTFAIKKNDSISVFMGFWIWLSVCNDNLTAQSFVIKTCEWILLGEITSQIRKVSLKNNGLEMLWWDKTIVNGLNFLEDLLRKCLTEHGDYFTFPAPFFHQNPLHVRCIGLSKCIRSMLLLHCFLLTSWVCSRWEGCIYGENRSKVSIFIEFFVCVIVKRVMTVCSGCAEISAVVQCSQVWNGP